MRSNAQQYRWRTSIHAVKPPELTAKDREVLDRIIQDRGKDVPKDMLIVEFAFLMAMWHSDAAGKVNLYLAEKRGAEPKCRLCNKPKEDARLPLCGDCRTFAIAAADRAGATLS